MNKKTFSAVVLAALLLTACQNDEEIMQTDTRVALQVTSGIQTRAYDDQWEENDDIGIFGSPLTALLSICPQTTRIWTSWLTIRTPRP